MTSRNRQGGPSAIVTPEDRDLVVELAHRISGMVVTPETMESLIGGLNRRMRETGYHKLSDYLADAGRTPEEFDRLVSALTIHTTSWFRELPHFEAVRVIAENFGESRPFRCLVAACSTGQESYSLGMVLERIRQDDPDASFDYRIDSYDIDPVSVDTAALGVYRREVAAIPAAYRRFMTEWQNTDDRVRPSRAIRSRCSFKARSLQRLVEEKASYDLIFCRNVLIYFTPDLARSIAAGLAAKLDTRGFLFVGHSETSAVRDLDLKRGIGGSYRHPSAGDVEGDLTPPVLVVDDSPTLRAMIKRKLAECDLDIAEAGTLEQADALLQAQAFRLVILDINLPDGNGLEWLQRARGTGRVDIPVLVVSGGSNVEDAVAATADGFVSKEELAHAPNRFANNVRDLVQGTSGPVRMSKATPSTKEKFHVLLVDDEAQLRDVMSDSLADRGFRALTAKDGPAALRLLDTHDFDVMVTDQRMPGLSGTELAKTAHKICPDMTIILLSGHLDSVTIGDSADLPIDEVFQKGQSMEVLYDRVADYIGSRTTAPDPLNGAWSPEDGRFDCVLIGASTGGPRCLEHVLHGIGPDFPLPVIVVQHIPRGFAAAFRNRLAEVSGLTFEAGDQPKPLRPGTLHMAEADVHLGLGREDGELVVRPLETPPVHGHRPGVDVLFHEAAKCPRLRGVAFLLTGMGRDGADGMVALAATRRFLTVAQDAESSIVFGMPRAAIDRGGARFVAGPEVINAYIKSLKNAYADPHGVGPQISGRAS